MDIFYLLKNHKYQGVTTGQWQCILYCIFLAVEEHLFAAMEVPQFFPFAEASLLDLFHWRS
jgi:hypothetical protein